MDGETGKRCFQEIPCYTFQYGGPGNQQVLNSWSSGSMGNGGAFDQYLAQQGFIIVLRRRYLRHRRPCSEVRPKCISQMGKLEAKDQVETAIYMGTLPYVDKDNIGGPGLEPVASLL